MNKPTIVLGGGSGFLGRSLIPLLRKHGYRVVILTRNPSSSRDAEVQEIAWDGKTLGGWCEALDGAAAVINLTGKSVNCRYTPKNRREIIDSRVDSVHAIAEALALCQRPPSVWVQASSLAIYGNTGEQWCSDDAPPGAGFPVEICLQWEQAFHAATAPQTRKAVLRIGLALGKTEGNNYGILGTLRTLVKAYLGGAVGTGRQYVSWIHTDDLNRMFLEVVENETLHGAFNATGPKPVTNAELMRELRHALRRPWSPPVPALVARLGAWLMRTEALLALTGRRCAPDRFLEHGFRFQFPELRPTLENVLQDSSTIGRTA